MSNHSRLYRAIGAVAVALVLLVAAVAAFFYSHLQPAAKLRVGFMRISPALPFFVAEGQQLFQKHQAAIEPVLYTSGLQMIDDLVNQRIDASITGPVDVLFARELESPDRFRIYLHAVYSPESPLYSLVVADKSAIRSTEDLRGKKIAVAPGVTNAMLLAMLLEKRHNFRRGVDYELVAVAPGQQLDALRASEFDALMPLEPKGTIAASSPDLRVIEWGPVERDVMNPLPVTAFAVSTTALRSKARDVRQFVSAIEEAVEIIRQDESSSRSLLVNAIDLTPEQAQKCGTGVFLTVAERQKADLQKFADLMLEGGAIKARVKVDPLYYRQ